MNKRYFFIVVLGVSLFCHGCASPPSSTVIQQSKAGLVDLGNGICQQGNGLMWQVAKSEVFASPREASAYIQALNQGSLGDWRLPTKNELYILCSLYDMKLGGDCPLKLKGSYWSMNGEILAGEWQVYSLCGGTEYQYLKSKTGRVLAVRP
ncbi:MAG: DUF1566 domain-containing protein [Proteobacteria bacterium]|nr:DUF1566 domain-containing protein [Pseudomonadota bacterium]MBU1641476.1 DUF1566 domain-containing protein [Pseudomonadota bacterium]